MKDSNSPSRIFNFSLLDDENILLDNIDKGLYKICVKDAYDLQFLTNVWINMFEEVVRDRNIERLAILIILYLNNAYCLKNNEIHKIDKESIHYKYMDKIFNDIVSSNFGKKDTGHIFERISRPKRWYTGLSYSDLLSINYYILINTWDDDEDSYYIHTCVVNQWKYDIYWDYKRLINGMIEHFELT